MAAYGLGFFFNFGTPRGGEGVGVWAGRTPPGIVKEMAGKWILGPKKSGWVGRLNPPPPEGFKKKPDMDPK